MSDKLLTDTEKLSLILTEAVDSIDKTTLFPIGVIEFSTLEQHSHVIVRAYSHVGRNGYSIYVNGRMVDIVDLINIADKL